MEDNLITRIRSHLLNNPKGKLIQENPINEEKILARPSSQPISAYEEVIENKCDQLIFNTVAIAHVKVRPAQLSQAIVESTTKVVATATLLPPTA